MWKNAIVCTVTLLFGMALGLFGALDFWHRINRFRFTGTAGPSAFMPACWPSICTPPSSSSPVNSS